MSSTPGNHRGRGRGGGYQGQGRGRNGGGGGGGFSGNYSSYQGRGRSGGGGDGSGGGFSGNNSSYRGRGHSGGGGGDGSGGGVSGNYSSYRGRGHRGGGGGDGGRGRGGSYLSRFDLHQANNQSSNRASSSWNSGQQSSSSTLERQFDQLSLQQEKELIRFPSRPPPGTIGERLWVRTNHFQVEIDSFLKEIFHYNVAITPEVVLAKDYKEIMRELANLYLNSHLGNSPLAYDGRKSFYTFDRLPFDSKEFPVTLVKEGSSKSREYVVGISLVAVIDLEKFRLFLNGKDIELPQTVIQALDVVLRQMPCSQ